MPKQSYWIRDVRGEHALVGSAAERDQWVKVHGWSEADEPGLTDQVHVVNENPEIGPGLLPYGAVEGWGGLGWKPGPPPGGESEPAAEPVKSHQTPTATSGDKSKEQVNG
jgi:hypothetical protein